MSLLIQGGTVVTADDGVVAGIADILIENGRIVEIGEELDAGDAEIIDAEGALVMPGLIDTHTHSWQFGFRGGLVRGSGFADYVKKFELYRHRYSPEDTLAAVRGCSLAQLNAGVTGVIDFVHGANDTPAHMRAAFDAHLSTGQRALVALGSSGSINEADSNVFETKRQERLAVTRALSDEVAKQQDPLVTVGLALLTPTATTEARVLSEIDFGRELGLQLTFHQNRPGEITMLHREERLGSDLIVVHSNTASSEEVGMLAETGTALSTTPESEVGAGWSPQIMRRALRQGIHMGIGIDTPSTETVNLWEQIRVLRLLMKALDAEEARRLGRYPMNTENDAPTMNFERALRIATRGGGYSLLGADTSLGTIAVGAPADVIIVRPDDAEVAFDDPASYLVQHGSPQLVETVIVGGVVRKRDFALVDIDPEELASTNRDLRRRIMKES